MEISALDLKAQLKISFKPWNTYNFRLRTLSLDNKLGKVRDSQGFNKFKIEIVNNETN